MTPSLTESQVYAALGDFLRDVTGLGQANIVRGQVNRVPMPAGPNWISMQATGRRLMATPERSYTYPVPVQAPVGVSPTGGSYTPALGTANIGRSTALYFQIDAYGPGSADMAQIVTQVFNDDYGASWFKAKGIGTLYCEDPSQMPLIAGEQQYIGRWMIRAVLHAFIVTATPQDFADTLVTTLSEITHAV